MRKYVFFALIALILTACGNSNERLLTSATGSIYDCLVVCDASLKDPIRATMGAEMYGLPQEESTFTVSHVPTEQFDNLVKGSRNILQVDINPNRYTQVKTGMSRDVWSKPQAMVHIQAPNKEAFLEYWATNGENIRDWFIREELARQIRFYRANTNKDARAILNKQGYDMLIPEDFMLIKNEKVAITNHHTAQADRKKSQITNDSIAVLWCCNNKGPMRKDILVYWYPYTAQEQFDNASITRMRDAVEGPLITAQVPGSHMGTEYKYFPPVSRNVAALRDTTGGFFAVETRGLWRILDGEAMGGPFVSLTRLDQVNGYVVTAEVFLYAAGQKKRNATRQLEAILYTLEMPNERQR